jgi:hypothetical protein
MDSKTLVDKILDSNDHIRFAAIFDMKANIVASKERKGVSRMLSEEDTKKWAHTAVNAWKKRGELIPKIGESKYVLAVYEKLKRITMPVDKNHLIYVTFDADGGQEDIIQDVLNQKPGYGTGDLTS